MKSQYETIEKRLESEWDDRTVIQYKGRRFQMPEAEDFIKIEISDYTSSQNTFGASTNRFRSMGEIIVTIFVPSGDIAENTARTYADVVAGIFRGWTSSDGISCLAPRIISLPETTASEEEAGSLSNYEQIMVVTTFRRDELL